MLLGKGSPWRATAAQKEPLASAALAAPRPKPFPGRCGSSRRQCCTWLGGWVSSHGCAAPSWSGSPEPSPARHREGPPAPGSREPGAPRLLSRQLGADVTSAQSATGGDTCNSRTQRAASVGTSRAMDRARERSVSAGARRETSQEGA